MVHDKTVFSKYLNNYFVETGTHQGLGVSLALEAGFQNIRSIELSPDLYQLCVSKFQNYQNVKLFLGNSSEKLWEMIHDINEPITFWLDAHCGIARTMGLGSSQVLNELEILKKHPIKSHTILIDDVRDMGGVHFDFVTKDQIISKIMEINPHYTISYENGSVDDNKIFYDDILVAKELK